MAPLPVGPILYAGLTLLPNVSTIVTFTSFDTVFVNITYSSLSSAYLLNQVLTFGSATLNIYGATNPDGSPIQLLLVPGVSPNTINATNASNLATILPNTLMTLVL